MKIIGLELENVKRVAVLRLKPSANGLTVIGGDNGQGKTSVLDAICYGLGGEKRKPSNLKRDGAIADAHIKITMSNGLVAERKGKNATLKVTDPDGKKSGQSILDAFTEELALDLPKFLNARPKDKAQYLLQTLGIGDQLYKLEDNEKKLYNERHAIGQIADRKTKAAEEMTWHDGLPEVPFTASELLASNQAILQRNAKRACDRQNIENLKAKADNTRSRITSIQNEMENLKKQLYDLNDEWQHLNADYHTASANPPEDDEPTTEIENKIAEIEELNAKIRINLDKTRATAEAKAAASEYAKLSDKIEAVKEARMKLLEGAKMPLPGMSVEDGELTLNGKKWDCMSGSEQLRASVAIVKSLKPQCGFVLIDGLEQMDVPTMNEFSDWLVGQGLQAIATRVSKGRECSIVIEDGRAVGVETAIIAPTVEADPEIEGF